MICKDKFCIECGDAIESVVDKDYPKLSNYYCNNIDCSRIGLITLIFNSEDRWNK